MNTSTETTKLSADILIVDDKLENIRFLSDFLSTQHYQVRKAINGQAALTAVKTISPDLILLDINMPGMSGYEVCERLKNNPETSSIPIIFLSAGSELRDKVRAFQLGGIDYITKPFQLEEVLIRVQTQLMIRELQKQLEEKNAMLIRALDSLKKAQMTLIQKEKTATLRKVVAGVAHEINNPLSFISCNIEPIREYTGHLLTLIELYQQKYSDSDPEIEDFIERISLDFLISDLDKITRSMKNGAERINTVVLALRIFTRLDESEIKQVNVHECIDTILALLRHRLSSEKSQEMIEIQKKYEKLPLITCYAEQLNQVIFNLLCNAIDAVALKLNNKAYQSYSPQISISTQVVDNKELLICIKDNGFGITKENQACLFEPFFTTKAAGQGIGLGLATSRGIIEDLHRGRLTYCSCAGEGTEFFIQIPI
jgi:two-component system, NtrC family, sensor kinase